MICLSVPLACGNEFCLQAPKGLSDFDELGRLLGMIPKPGVAKAPVASVSLSIECHSGVLVYSSPRGQLEMRLQEADRYFTIFITPHVLSRQLFRMFLWHYLVSCGGVGAVLQGLPVALVHGAILMHGDSAVLLCGDSGIGKSTTSRRWESLGHAFAADDMFLLEYGPDGRFYVHALPTWSRCRVKPEAPRVPFDRPLPVAGVLGLSRDDDNDVIEDVSHVVFLGHVLRSMTFHTSILVTHLPPEDQRLFSARVAATAGRVADAFPPRRLAANLTGDLAAALDGYLASLRR